MINSVEDGFPYILFVGFLTIDFKSLNYGDVGGEANIDRAIAAKSR